MQRGKVLNLSRLKFTGFFLENKILIIGLLLFIFGIVFGVSAVSDYSKITDFAKNFVDEFIELRNDATFFRIFLNSFFSSAMILLVFLILGTSIFGVVTVPFSVAVYGMFYGTIVSYIYSEFALRGIAFNAVIFLPSSIIFIIVLLLACREAVNFSLKISSLTVSKTVSYNISNQFKRFLIMLLIFVGLSIVSALVDATVSSAFIKYFNF